MKEKPNSIPVMVARPDFSSGSKQFVAHKLFENDIRYLMYANPLTSS